MDDKLVSLKEIEKLEESLEEFERIKKKMGIKSSASIPKYTDKTAQAIKEYKEKFLKDSKEDR